MTDADSTPDGLLGRVEGTLALVAAEHAEGYDSDCGVYFGCSCGWDNDTDEHNDGYAQHLAAMQVAALVADYGLRDEPGWTVSPYVEPIDSRLVTEWHPTTPSETTEESHD